MPQEHSIVMVRKMPTQSDLQELWIMSFKGKTRRPLSQKGLNVWLLLGLLTLK